MNHPATDSLQSPVPQREDLLDHARLAQCLGQSGISPGDIVYLTLDVSGIAAGGSPGAQEACKAAIIATFAEVLGPGGTLLVPAFSFSFLRSHVYDPDCTPSFFDGSDQPDPTAEYLVRLPGAVRSRDPIYSVAGFGPAVTALFHQLPNTSFGPDCLFERIIKAGAKVCGFGQAPDVRPFLHIVEESQKVPYRYNRFLSGIVSSNGVRSKLGWICNLPVSGDWSETDASRMVDATKDVAQSLLFGDIPVHTVNMAEWHTVVSEALRRDAWIACRGAARDVLQSEAIRLGERNHEITLSPQANYSELISALWQLPRDIVSGGYDAAIRALATQVPMTIHEFPSGLECWGWVLPEKWVCHEAYLETLDGRRLFSYADHPLHVVSYSLPFAGVVSRETLLEHLHVHPTLPDAIPFVFKYYEKDWGLCCSRELRDSLTEDRYRVVIRSDFGFGTLKVGEVIVPGKSQKSIVLCAHLCHPGMVNDDLSGVVVGLKVMQALLKRGPLQYTYRFLIVPETIGSIAFLSTHEQLIPELKGGLFLEMLGLSNPHALQLSFSADSEMDQCLRKALQDFGADGWTGPFRTVVGNDERQFNAPGVRVPMLSLSRVKRRVEPSDTYYPEYHSSRDNLALTSIKRLEESEQLVLRMVEIIENNHRPKNQFKGEVFCSRYGLHIDPYSNPEGSKALFDILFQIDGSKSIVDIANTANISFAAALSVIEELRRLGLVTYLPI